jgi:argininosuccinate lyase
MRTLWKQDTSLHPAFAPFNRSLEDDWFLFACELRLQEVHARALEVAGVLTSAERAALEKGLAELASAYRDAPCPQSDAEDLHTWVETELTARAGDAGRKIHTARSRNDQVATLLRMYVCDTGDLLNAALRKLVRFSAMRGIDWADLIFPLQTHTQFAAPGSVGFWALRFAASFARLRRTLAGHQNEWRRYCPLGAGAVAGSSIPIDRQIQAAELGFSHPSRNALEATSSRDDCLEFLALAAQAAVHLQSFATDIILFAQTPLGWVNYPRNFGTGSSMMPNKTNPDAMELVRGEACSLQGAHGQALLLLKGLPSGYNRDLQCIKPLVRDTAEKLLGLLELVAAFVGELQFNPDRLAAALPLGGIDATLRMEALVKAGTPLRDAHHAVADQHNKGLGASNAIGADSYSTIGSASPTETRRVAAQFLAELEG